MRTISIIIQFTTMNNNQLALIAELVEPQVRADNMRLQAQNDSLLRDLRRLSKTCRDVAHQNFDLQDQVVYLEAQLARLVNRVHLLESSILDCDDPSHDQSRSVRRRLVYDDEDIFEAIDLTTDEVLTP